MSHHLGVYFLRFVGLLYGESGVKAYPEDHVCVCAGWPTLGIEFLRSKKKNGSQTWLVLTLHNAVPIVKQSQGPYSIEHGLFLQLLQLPFVAIMLKIKT